MKVSGQDLLVGHFGDCYKEERSLYCNKYYLLEAGNLHVTRLWYRTTRNFNRFRCCSCYRWRVSIDVDNVSLLFRFHDDANLL